MKAIKKFIMMLGIMLLTGNVCLGQDVATYSDEVIDENGNVDLSSFNQLSDLEYKTDENGNVDISFVFDATNAGTKIAELVRIYYFYEDDDESVFGRRYISVMSGYGLTFISKECEDVHTERLVPDTISKVTVHNPEFLDKDKKLKSIAVFITTFTDNEIRSNILWYRLDNLSFYNDNNADDSNVRYEYYSLNSEKIYRGIENTIMIRKTYYSDNSFRVDKILVREN